MDSRQQSIKKNDKENQEEFSSDDEIMLSYLDQAFKRLRILQREISTEKAEEKKSHGRLFRNNMFEDIRAEQRQHLRRIMVRALSALGQNINQNLYSKETKKLLVLDRRNPNNYIFDKCGVIFLKSKRHIKYCETGESVQGLMLHIITKVLTLIQSNTYMTKRELYYLSKEFLQKGGPQKLHGTITDICCLVGSSQVNLNILSQTRGLVFGDLKYKLKSGESFDCMSLESGTSIPTGQYPIVCIESGARFILIVEKDSVFQKILNQEKASNFVKKYKAIIFTGKGYPDVPSRAFIHYLWSKLRIPVLALTDADPHGCEIVCCYKFGCYNTAGEQLYLAVPQIRWLGLLPTDVTRLGISAENTSSQSPIDTKKINSLLKRPYIVDRPEWKQQLSHLRNSGRKAELESLDTTGSYLVRTYLPNKLRFGAWL